MANRNHHPPEPIIPPPRPAEVELAAGSPVPQVCRKLGVTGPTYDRWREDYGGVRTDPAKRLEDLDRGSARRETLAAEAELDEAALKGAAGGSF